MSVRSARHSPDNDVTHNWPSFDEVTLHTDDHPFPYHLVTREDWLKFQALSKRVIKPMNAHSIQKLFQPLGFASGVKGVANLRNLLYATVLEADAIITTHPASTVRSGPVALSVAPLSIAPPAPIHSDDSRIKALEDTIALLRSELRGVKRSAPDSTQHVVRKQQRVEGHPAVRVFEHDDLTGTLRIQPLNNPLRVLFYSPGAIGYTGSGTPPSNSNVINEVCRKMRDLAVKIPSETLTAVLNFAWPVDLKYFAEAGMIDIEVNVRHLERALFNFATVVTLIHGDSIGRPLKEFHAHVNSLNGSRWPIHVVRKYIPLCLKHFVGDLQDVYDAWFHSYPDEDGFIPISIPKLGEDSPTPGVRKKIEELCDNWRHAVAPDSVPSGSPDTTTVSTRAAANGPAKVLSERAPKDSDGKQLCILFSEGKCRKGDKCMRSHKIKATAAQIAWARGTGPQPKA
jgi:hypothetical protein